MAIAVSLGLAALGAACVIWALSNIQAEAAASVEPYRAPASTLGPVLTRSATSTVFADATGSAFYATTPKKGARIGSLTIPDLKLRLRIVEGTDDDSLAKGVGHFTGSVLPGVTDNCVLSGHRDTVFSGVGKLKKGDLLVVETVAGTFTYALRSTRIVHKDDRTVIVPTDHAVLTLSTCYPFHYVGPAPDRYIITADLVASELP